MTDPAALILIRAAVRQLALDPRFKGRHFGPDGALEVLFKLYQYQATHPGTRWPAAKESSEAVTP